MSPESRELDGRSPADELFNRAGRDHRLAPRFLVVPRARTLHGRGGSKHSRMTAAPPECPSFIVNSPASGGRARVEIVGAVAAPRARRIERKRILVTNEEISGPAPQRCRRIEDAGGRQR